LDELEKWLAPLGLAALAPTLRANDIDLDILPALSETDLEKLGLSLGHRRKLLRAAANIARLSSSLSKPSAEQATIPSIGASAERRQLTVMFCDLVGSTALSARLDPEDMREIIGTYHRCCAEEITKAGGFVAKYMGDGVLAYFGYPEAHEDDAERGVRAGLGLIDAVPKLRTGQGAAPQVRIGIATGLVVVGDLIGEGAAQEQGVVGDTPNVAARLQSLAEPSQIVISDSTHRLIGSMFDYCDLGRVMLRGLADPVQAWQVLGASTVESRFEAHHGAALTPLVGREEELELLLRRWQRAKSGEGQVVLLSGEPGIGKSRLTVALQERLQAEPHTRLRYFCSPRHTDSAFYPTIAQLERAAKFDRQDAPEAKLDKLDSLLGSSPNRAGDVQLLAALLSIPTGDRYAALSWSPQQKKEKTIEALIRQLDALSRRRPVLMVYEDVHWVDPSSRELLDMAVERVARMAVLLFITFRPEFAPPWTGQSHVTTITLARLGRREGTALVERVAGNNALPTEIASEIVERTDGVPLFVEELTKAVLEVGVRSDGLSGVSAAPISALVVPATLQASLMARLDRLGVTAKEIAQIGAAIGREFSYELLVLVAQKNEEEVKASLGRLGDAGLVFCRGTPPQATFLFKHALVRDAAYGCLLRKQRQQLHARIASVLEEQSPEVVDQHAEFLAQHWTEAGSIKKAVFYWGKAGRQSATRSATIETVTQLRKGLELLSSLGESQERARMELELQRDLCAALQAWKGGAAPETGKAYARARVLCHQFGEKAALVPVLSGHCHYHLMRGNYPEAREIAEELLRLGQLQNDAACLLLAHRSVAHCLHQLGEFASAVQNFTRVISLYTLDLHQSLTSILAYDMRVGALAYISWDLLILGFPDQALSQIDQALALSRKLQHPPTLAYALTMCGCFNRLRHVEHATEEPLRELIDIATEQNFSFFLALATMMRGHALVARGDTEEGLALARKGLNDKLAIGSVANQTYYLGLLARSCARAGRIDDALSVLATALDAAESMGERWFEAELHRMSGEYVIELRSNDEARAEACFCRAVALAQRQNAKLWELRAAASLARLWRDQGKRAEAHDLLAPIYGWFTEGFDTPDLKDAKALLDELA
jgi:predicted ATPase/class 3 adenylate cyclase